MISLNDTFLVEPYEQGQGLKGNIKSGFAYIAQKQNLIGLKLVIDAKLSDGSVVKAGSKIYIAEDLLTTQEWAKKNKTADFTEGKEFVIVEKRFVTAVERFET